MDRDNLVTDQNECGNWQVFEDDRIPRSDGYPSRIDAERELRRLEGEDRDVLA